MTTLLALAALGPWAYADFLADPAPAPTPAPAPAPASKPIPAVAIKAEPEPGPGPGPTVPAPPPKAPRPPAPPTVPAASTAPVVYRMADVAGQVWEHPDPAQLRRFVEARNRSAFAPVCGNGRCR